jgi:hypothetical protein
MTLYRNYNNGMYLHDWYSNYLMKYVNIISKPKYSIDVHRKYSDKLLEWYENWNGEPVEVDEEQWGGNKNDK